MLCLPSSIGRARRADIDDAVGRFLPELHPVAREVSMRQLMANVSGLRDAHDIASHLSGDGRLVSSSELLTLYREIDDVNAPPGSTWIDNNGGYVILSAVIERVTGESLEEVLRRRVFNPVGLYDTVLRCRDTDFLPGAASLHRVNAAGDFEKSVLGNELVGEGGIVSTLDDMLRWLAHMDSPVIGTESAWATIKRPHVLINGVSTGYGLGLRTRLYRGLLWIAVDGIDRDDIGHSRRPGDVHNGPVWLGYLPDVLSCRGCVASKVARCHALWSHAVVRRRTRGVPSFHRTYLRVAISADVRVMR